MNLVLLSGGSGQRLWPLSNDIRSKQFIKICANRSFISSAVCKMDSSICRPANATS